MAGDYVGRRRGRKPGHVYPGYIYSRELKKFVYARERTEKRCSKCGQTKPVSEFRKITSSNDGLSVYCDPCQGAYWRENLCKHYEHRWPKMLVTYARNGAKRRGCEFSLTIEDVLDLYRIQEGRCYWFDVPLVPVHGSRYPQTPSLDRIDCSRGYTRDNVVLACLAANYGRMDNNIDTFREFCQVLRCVTNSTLLIDPRNSDAYSIGSEPSHAREEPGMADAPELTLAERLHILRERTGLTIWEAGARAGMGVKDVSRLFKGENVNPKIKTLERLVTAMGFTLADLFALEAEDRPGNFSGEGG